MSTKRSYGDGGDEYPRKRAAGAREEDVDEVEDVDEDVDDEDDEEVLKQTVVSWQTEVAGRSQRYTAKIKVLRHYEVAEMKHVHVALLLENKPIGYLDANILPRPNHNFFGLGDMVSDELSLLVTKFCNSKGHATRISTNLEGTDVYSGGFLHISEVEVAKAHKGQDLALRMLHEVLVFLRGDWNLAVFVWEPITREVENRLNMPQSSFHSANSNLSLAEKKRIMANTQSKIARHFGRMGFQQAGRNADDCSLWYMTSVTYFGQSQDRHVESSSLINQWKTKEQMLSIDIFFPPAPHEPTGPDKELKELVSKSIENVHDTQAVLNQIKQLILGQRASIHNSRALFVLAANEATEKSKILFQALVRLGADVNAPDEHGNRPLHTAVIQMNINFVKYLVSQGAIKTLVNNAGETPLKKLEQRLQDLSDFNDTFSLHIRNPKSVNSKLEALFTLLPSESLNQLVHGWLSPRMMKMFEITASLAVDMINYSGESFQKFQATPLSKCTTIFCGIYLIEYIPTTVLALNHQGLYKSFCDGWGIVWSAILSILKKRQAPTLARVRQEIYTMGADFRKWQHFEQKGGKIHFALDALIKVTKNVYTDGDDGWEYDTYKDEIESMPATPFDNMFDVAQAKLFEGDITFRAMGPYRHHFEDDGDIEGEEDW